MENNISPEQEQKALKICGRCKVAKDLSSFRAQKRGKFGKKSFCIECDDAYNRARYLRTPRRIIKQVQDYHAKNKERRKAYNRDYGINRRLKNKGIL